jgi:hypothetical protein
LLAVLRNELDSVDAAASTSRYFKDNIEASHCPLAGMQEEVAIQMAAKGLTPADVPESSQ